MAFGLASGAVEGAVVRTFVHHEISRLSRPFSTSPGQSPVISADGRRAVFTLGPGSQDPANPNRIYVASTDGTEIREIDAYRTLCFCGSLVDISADGSRVISSDGVQLRLASADTGGGRALVTLTSSEITAIRISGDGSQLFFALSRNATLSSGAPIAAGLYAVNADGGGIRHIAGTPQIARLLGLPPEQTPFGVPSANALSVSEHGSRIAFGSYVQPEAGGAGQGIFAVNGDGSGLVSLTGRQAFATASISPDGSTVAYNIRTLDAVSEVGVVPAGGGARRALIRQAWNAPSPIPTGFPDLFADRLTLTKGGQRLLLGSTGVLMETATGAALQLAIRGGSFFSDPSPILYDGIYLATMDQDATRVLYLARDDRSLFQLVVMEFEPANLGEAPAITDVSLSPEFLLLQPRSPATVRARVSTPHALVRVGAAALYNGLIAPGIELPVLLDDGTQGDSVARDGLYATNRLWTSFGAIQGTHTLRVKAEARDARGYRHATVVEIGPFEVRRQ